ncbi:hypothetical protein CXB51_034151 [Gossypium anomalum]|uniref:Aminotransferase-like plant mobile domain-containing protein n=1 Tax=Gossypium anomalum TaxID=47600 RepID=A0A8J5XZR6_9ROSI|nr:hypothetical protein CXB51_034151 [Gossypium anomalum]
MSGPPSPLIENYLMEASFWHVATIGRGCKLDPKLISALIERWRPEIHIFHLSCEECTIILEDMQLQLGLSLDGSILAGSVQSVNLGAVCYNLLEQLANLVESLSCWQYCTGRCARRRHQIKPKLEVAYQYYNHGLGFAFHFYVIE